VQCLWSERLPVVRDGYSTAGSGVFENVMAAASAVYDKTGSEECIYGLFAACRRQFHAATSTMASSVVSSVGMGIPSASRLSI